MSPGSSSARRDTAPASRPRRCRTSGCAMPPTSTAATGRGGRRSGLPSGDGPCSGGAPAGDRGARPNVRNGLQAGSHHRHNGDVHVFVSGRVSIDLAGTLKWRRHAREELLTDGQRVAEWIVQAGLLTHSPDVGAAGVDEVRRLREIVYAATR